MNTLKPCPFCGKMPDVADDGVCRCNNKSCSMAPYWYLPKYWNIRPIEDELSARIAELEDQLEDWTNNGWAEDYKARIAELDAEVTKGHELQDAYCDRIAELENELEGKRVFTDTLFYDIYRLQSRIAELEAEIDQLTADSTDERKDDKSPNDTQTQTIVYGKESEECQTTIFTGAKMNDKFTEDFIKEQLSVMEKFEKADCSPSPEYLAGRNAAIKNYADALRKILLLEHEIRSWCKDMSTICEQANIMLNQRDEIEEGLNKRIAELEEKQRWIPVTSCSPDNRHGRWLDRLRIVFYRRQGR